mgnify:CR=1 FL=1
MKNYLDDKERERIISFGRSRGWSQEQTVQFMLNRNHKAYVASEKRRIAAENKKRREEFLKKQKEQHELDKANYYKELETVQLSDEFANDIMHTGTLGYEFKGKDFKFKDGEWYYLKPDIKSGEITEVKLSESEYFKGGVGDKIRKKLNKKSINVLKSTA